MLRVDIDSRRFLDVSKRALKLKAKMCDAGVFQVYILGCQVARYQVHRRFALDGTGRENKQIAPLW